jgi:hypothetical protein
VKNLFLKQQAVSIQIVWRPYLFDLQEERTILVFIAGSPWQVGVMTGSKMAVLGEAVRLVAAGTTAVFELSALGFSHDDIDVQIISEAF